jgi:polyphosphate kinase
MKSSSAKPKSAKPPPPGLREADFINRELSWLAFNERVLEEAARTDLPLLERAKFLAITASNLDEFMMVRVGGLQYMKDQGKRVRDDAGFTATQQLEQIESRVREFISRQCGILNGQLLPALRSERIHRMKAADLSPAQKAYLEDFFLKQIYPALSPIALEEGGQIGVIPALQISLLFSVTSGTTARLVLMTMPQGLSRQVMIPDTEPGGYVYINLEDLVELFLQKFFPSEQVSPCVRFRISRNSDIAVDDDSAVDLAAQMEEVLEQRLVSSTIRLEIEEGGPRDLVKTARDLFATAGTQVYTIPGELDLRAYFQIAGLPGFESLKVQPWESHASPAITNDESIFDAIRRQDILLHHPYESFDPVLQLVEEAAADPGVIAIKQILYRTAKNSRIISALIRAAQAGKHVTVLVELKARFDEERNLERANDLMNAGAQIIYGVRGLKTHAKICLVMRREAGHMRRYVHFGTGNYNESTARMYTDISYLTCREDYGADASAFFNTVTGRSRFVHFDRISMAPFGLRERLVSMIRSEAERARQGEKAEIMLKMNALEDREMIGELCAASAAGVSIRLNIRGICCLRPGVKGLSENIRVVSIIDRHLEHARIFHFRQGGHPVVFIASADFMTRNLSKRVELLIPVEDPAAKKRLIHILETHFADNAQARALCHDGGYVSLRPASGKMQRSQESFAKEAARRAKQRVQAPDVLVPHRPKTP